MTNRALKIGQLIANAHPADVRLLFQEYGISVPPTGKTILDAVIVHGKPFAERIARIALQNTSQFSRMDAPKLETEKLIAQADAGYTKAAAEQAALDKSKSGGLVNVLTGAGSILSTAANAWDDISNIFSGNKSVSTGGGNANTALELELYKLDQERKAAEEGNNTKTYLLIGAGILVVVLVVIMYLKNKK